MAIDDVDNVLAKRKHAGVHHLQQQVGANVTNPPGVTKIPEAVPQAACDPTKAPDSAPLTAGNVQQGDLGGEPTNALATVADSMLDDLLNLLADATSPPPGAPTAPAAPDVKGAPDAKGAPAEKAEGAEKAKHAKKGGGGGEGPLQEIDTPTEILLVDDKGNVVETIPKPVKPATDQPKVQELSGSQGAAQTVNKSQPLSPQELLARDPDRIKRIGGPETPR